MKIFFSGSVSRLPVILAFLLVPGPWLSPAEAEVVFDNGDPELGFGVSMLSEIDHINQVGDDFILAASTRLERLEWWGDEDGGSLGIRIFAIEDGAPVPEPLHELEVHDPGRTEEEFPGGSFTRYVTPLPGLLLPAGRYLLSIVDTSEDGGFFWAASCEDGCEGDSWRRVVDGEPWRISNFDLAFRLEGGEPLEPFLRGDCNLDGTVDLSDAIRTIAILFLGQERAGCDDACDSNDDGALDLSDPVRTLSTLFLGADELPPPGTRTCGHDPTVEELLCRVSSPCL